MLHFHLAWLLFVTLVYNIVKDAIPLLTESLTVAKSLGSLESHVAQSELPEA